ncbi:MAG: hypothetical protein HY820_35335 [Acidobacteria bacterium]|nr:hypothetical protein [Acidobacteriota bacterium]
MRLKKIKGYDAANGYLEESYLPQHNCEYAVKPAAEMDFHEPLPKGVDLEEVSSLEWERKVSNDRVAQWQGRWFQIGTGTAVQPGRTVIVQQRQAAIPPVVPIRSRRQSKTEPAASGRVRCCRHAPRGLLQ